MSSRLVQPPTRPTALASCTGTSTLTPHHLLLMPTILRCYKTPKPSPDPFVMALVVAVHYVTTSTWADGGAGSSF